MKGLFAYRALAAVGASALVVLAGFPAQATARHTPSPSRTITTGLDGPYGLDVVSSRTAIVAEGDSGEVTTVDLKSGRQRTVLSGLTAPAGVTEHNGRIYVVLGGAARRDHPRRRSIHRRHFWWPTGTATMSAFWPISRRTN